MPHSDQHEKQKVKNYAVLLAILAFVAVVFVVSIVRMSGAQ